VTLALSRTVAKVESIGFVVRSRTRLPSRVQGPGPAGPEDPDQFVGVAEECRDGHDMNTAERIVVGVNTSRAARQALSWATREARLDQAPLLIVRDQPNAADAVGLHGQVQFSDSPNDLDPIEAVHAI
jgi:hypothetical protein